MYIYKDLPTNSNYFYVKQVFFQKVLKFDTTFIFKSIGLEMWHEIELSEVY